MRSEKANLEQHILGMESELEALQEQRGTLERDLESQRRACSGLQLQIDTLRTEVSWLTELNFSRLLLGFLLA